MARSKQEEYLNGWFDPVRYGGNHRFNARDWAAQIYRRAMIRRLKRMRHEGGTISKERLEAHVESLKRAPLAVPDWVAAAQESDNEGSAVHPLRIGDLRAMLGEWRDSHGDHELQALPNAHGEVVDAAIPADSTEIIWNAVPGEDDVLCDSLFAAHERELAQAHVAIDLHAPLDRLLADVKAYVTALRDKIALNASIPDRPFQDLAHPWAKDCVLECFDIDFCCETELADKPSKNTLLRVLNSGQGSSRADTIRANTSKTISFDTWFSLLAHARN